MRTALILIQAAIITVVAVIGAQGETEHPNTCPLPQPQAVQSCAS